MAHSGAGHYLQSSISNYFSEHYLWRSELIQGFSSFAFVRVFASNARRVIDAKYTALLHETVTREKFAGKLRTRVPHGNDRTIADNKSWTRNRKFSECDIFLYLNP